MEYPEQVRRLQGTAPERIAVVTGDGRLHHYRLDDYDAYFRRVRRRFEERLLSAERGSTYPEPVEHCRICRFWQECADRRRDDDHLSRVAGLTRLQAGVNTARREAYEALLGDGFRIDMLGVILHRPDEPGYSRPGVYALDDWR